MNCIECSQQFRTYIPGTHCLMPDGGITCHQEPLLHCPDCEYDGIAMALNKDLFPHLK